MSPRKKGTTPRRSRKPKRDTPLEDKFEEQLKERGITGFEREVKFIPGRKFSADFYNPDLKVCVEIDGGIFMANSGHTSGNGYTSDRERDLLALHNGVLTLRFTSKMVTSEFAVAQLERLLKEKSFPLWSDS